MAQIHASTLAATRINLAACGRSRRWLWCRRRWCGRRWCGCRWCRRCRRWSGRFGRGGTLIVASAALVLPARILHACCTVACEVRGRWWLWTKTRGLPTLRALDSAWAKLRRLTGWVTEDTTSNSERAGQHFRVDGRLLDAVGARTGEEVVAVRCRCLLFSISCVIDRTLEVPELSCLGRLRRLEGVLGSNHSLLGGKYRRRGLFVVRLRILEEHGAVSKHLGFLVHVVIGCAEFALARLCERRYSSRHNTCQPSSCRGVH